MGKWNFKNLSKAINQQVIASTSSISEKREEAQANANAHLAGFFGLPEEDSNIQDSYQPEVKAELANEQSVSPAAISSVAPTPFVEEVKEEPVFTPARVIEIDSSELNINNIIIAYFKQKYPNLRINNNYREGFLDSIETKLGIINGQPSNTQLLIAAINVANIEFNNFLIKNIDLKNQELVNKIFELGIVEFNELLNEHISGNNIVDII